LAFQSPRKEGPGTRYKREYIKCMNKELNIEEVKRIVKEELEDMIDGYSVAIEDVKVDMENQKVQVTFGLSTVDSDNYIGLCFY
jgi:hypothetical protein